MLQSNTSSSERHEDGVEFAPFPLIEFPRGDFKNYYYTRQIWMVIVHNIVIRGLSSILAQGHVPQSDGEKASFVSYILCWWEFTHLHHVGEEKFFFPECEKRSPGSMVENTKQHRMFQNGLETLRDYCAQVQKTPLEYDANKIITIIQSFGDSFCLHLHEEIDTLAPDKMRAIFPDQRDLKKTQVDMIRWKISHATKRTMLPWILSHHEAKTAPWWPTEDIPRVVIFLARHVFSKFNRSYWNWSPCTFYSVMKPEARVGTVQPLNK